MSGAASVDERRVDAAPPESVPHAAESASRHLARRVPTAPPDASVGEARERLLGERFDTTELLYFATVTWLV